MDSEDKETDQLGSKKKSFPKDISKQYQAHNKGIYWEEDYETET